jgi:hypothetical protein
MMKDDQKFLEGYGIKILRFKNSDVFKNFGEVCRIIETELYTGIRKTNLSESIYESPDRLRRSPPLKKGAGGIR